MSLLRTASAVILGAFVGWVGARALMTSERGAETIRAECPTAWEALDDGNAWRYLCNVTSVEIVFLKTRVTTGLTIDGEEVR